MHLSWAELKIEDTIIPDHYFVSGVTRSFATSNYCKNICLMYHFDDPDASSELSWKFLTDFIAELEYFKTFLRSNREVGLVLVEWNVQNLLLIFLHLLANY